MPQFIASGTLHHVHPFCISYLAFRIEAAKAATSGRVEGLVKEMDQEARSENRNQEFKGVAIPYSVLESRAAVNTALTAGSKMATDPNRPLFPYLKLSTNPKMMESLSNSYHFVLQY